ncbi:unnamed protein product [Ixodes pacificus]
MHYFRTLPEQWEDRLTTMKTAGLNTLQTYIEWSSHEPENGQYDFEGQRDIVRFIKIAERLGFLVILRPGPFIDAERDMVSWKNDVTRRNGVRPVVVIKTIHEDERS